MPITRTRARAPRGGTGLRIGALVLTGVLVSACGSGSSGSEAGPITLTIDLFGSFGYQEAGLYEKYEQLNPGITIKQTDTEDEQDYWKSLQTRLVGGGGLADIQAIEVGRITSVTQRQADRFEDLTEYGAGELEEEFTEAKWAAATTGEGAVLGLGTDVGPQAMCYRSDLLRKAGLPTDRDELAGAWSTWAEYLELGREYTANAPDGSAWMDSVGSLYAVMIGQEKQRYYTTSGDLIYADNPAVRTAWNTATEAAESGLSAELDQWAPQWNQAFSAGSFATLPCPAWMLGYIKGQAGDAGEGKWDIATLPGGAGNWGGSYLSIPSAAEHKEEAYKLLQWLTAAEQQAELFRKQGNFPSSTGAITDITDATDPYFSGAPIGEIFGEAAEEAPVQILGVHDKDISDQIINGLSEVERKGTAPDEAWSNAVKGIENVLG